MTCLQTSERVFLEPILVKLWPASLMCVINHAHVVGSWRRSYSCNVALLLEFWKIEQQGYKLQGSLFPSRVEIIRKPRFSWSGKFHRCSRIIQLESNEFWIALLDLTVSGSLHYRYDVSCKRFCTSICRGMNRYVLGSLIQEILPPLFIVFLEALERKKATKRSY